jgi:HK97 family phage major capsid protein
MNRNESRALREERAAIAAQMSELATGGLKTPEDRTKFDALDGAQKELKTRIDRIESAGDLRDELRGSGAPPAGQPDGMSDDERLPLTKQKRYASAFHDYLMYGAREEGSAAMHGRMTDEHRRLVLQQYERRDMATGGQGAYPGATTGFFVPVGFVQRVTDALKYYGPMLDGGKDMPTIMPTDTGQPLPFPTDNDTTISGELIGENQPVNTQDVTLSQIVFGAFKFSTKMVKVSLELMQDSAFNIEEFLTKKFATRLGRILNTKFTVGVGTTEPTGIVTAATSAGTAVGSYANDGVGAGNSIGSDDLVTLEHSVDILYRRGGRYMMHDTVIAAIKKIKDKYGRPLWLPGIAVNAPDTINGYPYSPNNDLDQLQTVATSPVVTRKTVLFGQLPLYTIRRVNELSVLRLEERFADYGQVAFIGFARYDGNLLDAGTHPVKYLQNVY